MAKKAGNKLGERFELAQDNPVPRFIGSIDGEVGTGKTYFACTAPAPIFYGNLDLGLNGVVEQFIKDGKEIYVPDGGGYEWSGGDVEDDDDDGDHNLQEAAQAVRAQWEKDAYYAIKNGARTLVVDTESRFWQVYRYAEFGAPNADNQPDYDVLNQRFEKIINVCKKKNINLIMLRSMKDDWGMHGKSKKTPGKASFGRGGRKVWGYSHLVDAMEVELTLVHRTPKQVAEDEEALGEYVMRFGKCRFNVSLQFTTHTRGDFADVGTLMLPDTSREDWQ